MSRERVGQLIELLQLPVEMRRAALQQLDLKEVGR